MTRLKMRTVQIQNVEYRRELPRPSHFERLICLKCGFEPVGFDRFCYHAKLCKIPIGEVASAHV